MVTAGNDGVEDNKNVDKLIDTNALDLLVSYKKSSKGGDKKLGGLCQGITLAEMLKETNRKSIYKFSA